MVRFSRVHPQVALFFVALEMEAIDLKYEDADALRVSINRQAYAGRPPVMAAILALDPKVQFYGRLHAAITQGSPIEARVFYERSEAAAWLGVPLQRLEGEAADLKT